MAEGELDPDAILAEEFDYVAGTAHQAHEDRVRVYQHLMATVATLLVAAILNQSDVLGRLGIDSRWFSVLFLVLAAVGVLSFLKLVRLREAWAESVVAMNTIKEHYTGELDDLDGAFAWTTDDLPDLHRFDSVGFLVGLTVAVVNAISIAASAFFADPEPFRLVYVALLGGIALGAVLLHVGYWRARLRREDAGIGE